MSSIIFIGFYMISRQNQLKNDVAFFLRRARRRKGLTGKEFGRLLNVSQQQISRYERGTTSITIEQLDSILDCLDVDWNYFFNEVLAKYSSDFQ